MSKKQTRSERELNAQDRTETEPTWPPYLSIINIPVHHPVIASINSATTYTALSNTVVNINKCINYIKLHRVLNSSSSTQNFF